MSFERFGNTTGYTFVTLSGLASAFLIAQFFRPSFWNRFGPKTEITGRMNTEDLTKVKIGDRGISIGAIRPSGSARFGNEIVEVHSKHTFIPENSAIEVIALEENRIIIKPID
jgi:membrane-bound ClpP family serine protease